MRWGIRLVVVLTAAAACVGPARADEGGVSYWLPGTFGSLAAVPSNPGWFGAMVYYHTSVAASGEKQFQIGGGIQAGLDADVDMFLRTFGYTFETPVLGGRAAVSMTGVFGRNKTSVEATLIGPGGGVISGEREQTITGFGDLYPQANLKWNYGVHNFMVYTQWGLPVGRYEASRLANLGIGHWAADGGAGYTYFNPQTGWEFSIVGGLTYNFKNPATDYQNGIDAHIDWAASKFLSQQVHVGVVGYLYQQLTGDSGTGATLGPFKSRVAGIGPQVGYIFPVNIWPFTITHPKGAQGYLNVKGYYEFAAENRPEGWNVWLTLAVSPAAPPPPVRLVTK